MKRVVSGSGGSSSSDESFLTLSGSADTFALLVLSSFAKNIKYTSESYIETVYLNRDYKE
jgi:hypothetical protein